MKTVLLILGCICFTAGLLFFIYTFYPVITTEITYRLDDSFRGFGLKQRIVPKDLDFGIVIPKIFANARIIDDIDPYNAEVYRVALTKGIAHARGSSYPGGIGNTFLFSHSSVNFYEANKFNSVFYLLDKLEKEDEIDIYFDRKIFKYAVTDKKLVDAGDVSYLSGSGSEQTLTLMTCWPPGTTFKRLLVIAKPMEE